MIHEKLPTFRITTYMCKNSTETFKDFSQTQSILSQFAEEELILFNPPKKNEELMNGEFCLLIIALVHPIKITYRRTSKVSPRVSSAVNPDFTDISLVVVKQQNFLVFSHWLLNLGLKLRNNNFHYFCYTPIFNVPLIY